MPTKTIKKKRPAGRPYLGDKGCRLTFSTKVLISEGERLRLASEEAGVTISKFIRRVIQEKLGMSGEG